MIASPTLYELITNETNKIPDKSGNTPLINRALQIANLEKFSKQKEDFEKEVCELVVHFDKLNQTHFTELESYITISNFYTQNILFCFSRYIMKVDSKEDIYIKACVVRFIQIFNKSVFQVDYIKKRFQTLKINDPWLFAEIISNVNWEEGVFEISKILKRNKDTSYLFPLITKWMTEQGNEKRLNYAFNFWYTYLTNEDKQLLTVICHQYGYSLENQNDLSIATSHANKNSNYVEVLANFKKANTSLKFETITP